MDDLQRSESLQCDPDLGLSETDNQVQNHEIFRNPQHVRSRSMDWPSCYVYRERDDLELLDSGLAFISNDILSKEHFNLPTPDARLQFETGHFLRLSLEIRELIYGYVLPHQEEVEMHETLQMYVNPHRSTGRTLNQMALMRLNHQIYRETSNFVYGRMQVRFAPGDLSPELRAFDCNDDAGLEGATCSCRYFPFHKVGKVLIEIMPECYKDTLPELRAELLRVCWVLRDYPLKDVEVAFWDNSYLPVPILPETSVAEHRWPFPLRNVVWDIRSYRAKRTLLPLGAKYEVYDFFNDPLKRELFFWFGLPRAPRWPYWLPKPLTWQTDHTHFRQRPESCENRGRGACHLCSECNQCWWQGSQDQFHWTGLTELEILLQPLKLLQNVKICSVHLTPLQLRWIGAEDAVRACRQAMTSLSTVHSVLEDIDATTAKLMDSGEFFFVYFEAADVNWEVSERPTNVCSKLATIREALGRILDGSD